MQRPRPRIVGNPSNAPALSSAYCIFFTKAMAMDWIRAGCTCRHTFGHQNPDRRRSAGGVRQYWQDDELWVEIDLDGRRTASRRPRPGAWRLSTSAGALTCNDRDRIAVHEPAVHAAAP